MQHLVLEIIQADSSQTDDLVGSKRVFVNADDLQVFLAMVDVESVVMVPYIMIVADLFFRPGLDLLVLNAEDNSRTLARAALSREAVEVFALDDRNSENGAVHNAVRVEFFVARGLFQVGAELELLLLALIDDLDSFVQLGLYLHLRLHEVVQELF